MLVYTLSKIDPRPAAPCIHPPANPPEGKREMRGQGSGPASLRAGERVRVGAGKMFELGHIM